MVTYFIVWLWKEYVELVWSISHYNIIIDSLFIGHSTKNKVEGFLECFVYQTMRLNSRLMINTCKLLMDYNNCATMLKIMVKNAQCLKHYSQLILISL